MSGFNINAGEALLYAGDEGYAMQQALEVAKAREARAAELRAKSDLPTVVDGKRVSYPDGVQERIGELREQGLGEERGTGVYGSKESKDLFEWQKQKIKQAKDSWALEKKKKSIGNVVGFLKDQVSKSPGDISIEYGDEWKAKEQREANERTAPAKVFYYPEGLTKEPELMNWMKFTMFEAAGYGLNSQQESVSDEPTSAAYNKLFGFDYGGLIGKGGLKGKIGGAAEKAAAALETPLGAGAMSVGGALILGGPLSEVLISGVGGKVSTTALNNFGYPATVDYDAQGRRQITPPGTGDFGFVQEVTGFKTANVKVNKTVALYMPSSLKTSYGVEYSEEDFSQLTQFMTGVKGIAGTVQTFINKGGQKLEDQVLMKGYSQLLARHALDTVNKSASGFIGQVMPGIEDLKIGKFYEGTSRQVQNPFVVNMYKNTKRRSFEFSFKFTPRSREEVFSVYNIIHTFKRYSLPKRVDELAGRLLEYPAEFQIEFMHGADRNQFLPRIGRCALKDINVTYGDEPFTTFFPDPAMKGAAPTKIELSLTFEELEILTQERINQGF